MINAGVAVARYSVQKARPVDVRAVSTLLAESARWMHGRGFDAWPEDGFPDERIMLDIDDRTCWLVLDHHGRDVPRAVATFVLDSRPDVEFISAGLGVEGEPIPDALVLHKMAVARDLAGRGIGTLILDWAADRAACDVVDPVTGRTRDWLMVNVARRARPLQAWYIMNGFEYITTVTDTGRPSGTLLRRPARARPNARRQLREAATT
jgi:GNAT superfamily N-acetyltransferase